MSVQTLQELMGVLSRYTPLTDEEQDAARVLCDGVARVLPKGRIWTVLSDDADPALLELESIARDVSEIEDSLALVVDRLTEVKRLRASATSEDR